MNDDNLVALAQGLRTAKSSIVLSYPGSPVNPNIFGGIIIWTIQDGWLPANATGGRAPNALFQALKQGFIDP